MANQSPRKVLEPHTGVADCPCPNILRITLYSKSNAGQGSTEEVVAAVQLLDREHSVIEVVISSMEVGAFSDFVMSL